MKKNIFFFLSGIIAGMYLMYGIIQHNFYSIIRAVAVIYPTQGNKATGTVIFQKQANGTQIQAQLQGLSPGKHGFHIHEFGDCSCADALCTKGHFNPTQQPHGGLTSEKRHVGDLGNIIADKQGNATINIVDPLIMLNGPQSIIGRSVIVHADEDDLVSQPSGNAGARIGCGVIGIAAGKK
ncbi:MAG: superoxide dismutase family protein [Candidatus Babeliales bacterium]|jgi:superoxide dismutase, Cu-Zn family